MDTDLFEFEDELLSYTADRDKKARADSTDDWTGDSKGDAKCEERQTRCFRGASCKVAK